jgi:hypothetical protein
VLRVPQEQVVAVALVERLMEQVIKIAVVMAEPVEKEMAEQEALELVEGEAPLAVGAQVALVV